MQRKFEFAPGEFYHLYNRGNSKQKIFLDPSDKERFIRLLFLANSHLPLDKQRLANDKFSPFNQQDIFEDQIVDLGAYCTLDNHFHILAREKKEGGISEFMSKLSTSHAMYFNKKYKRSGGLFEGTFRAKHVDNDEYLRYLFAYIHINPIKIIDPEWKEKGVNNLQKATKFLEQYGYSSYLDYTGKRPANFILNKSAFPEYFSEQYKFENFIDDWLKYSEDSTVS